jgi:hypothetical protein
MKKKKWIMTVFLVLALTMLFGMTVCAAGKGDVAGAIEKTWEDASEQIKTVVNKVVFPAIDLVLAVFFFVKLGTAYFDYRKQGQFEWTAPAILFVCLFSVLPINLYSLSVSLQSSFGSALSGITNTESIGMTAKKSGNCIYPG